MKRTLLYAALVSLLLSSCDRGDEALVETQQYNQRSSGSLSLGRVNSIVVQNQMGPVIIEGSPDTSVIGCFMDKTVSAESQEEADQVFSEMVTGLQTNGDTAYVSVQVPTGSVSTSSLLSLTLPDRIPCILRKVSGTTDVAYLQTSFVGENVAATTIRAHEGNCVLNGSSGDVSIQISLPDSGLCRVNYDSGNISVGIPTSTSSLLSAQTGAGTILYSGIVINDLQSTSHSLTGRMGSGRGRIQLITGKGNIGITGY
ncbi:MAG TPA: hypothetical protein VLX91_00300 [Candidatus Acidoferrales bacterium]|nr:hypothetical protein [Candidatus Acidoferrales bacterium]